MKDEKGNEVVESGKTATDSKVAVLDQAKPMTELERMQQRLTFLESHLTIIEGLLLNVATGQGVTKPTPKFKTTGAKRVLDTKSGITYESLGKCGAVVAVELGLKVHNFVYYECEKACPGRFQKLD